MSALLGEPLAHSLTAIFLTRFRPNSNQHSWLQNSITKLCIFHFSTPSFEHKLFYSSILITLQSQIDTKTCSTPRPSQCQHQPSQTSQAIILILIFLDDLIGGNDSSTFNIRNHLNVHCLKKDKKLDWNIPNFNMI